MYPLLGKPNPLHQNSFCSQIVEGGIKRHVHNQRCKGLTRCGKANQDQTVGGVNCFGPVVEFTRTFVLQKAELEKVEMGGADVDSLAKRVEQLERRVGSR